MSKTKFYRAVLFCIVGILTFSSVYGQKAREVKADGYFTLYAFEKAIDEYTKVKDLSNQGQRRLAESYKNIRKYPEAEREYAKFVDTNWVTKDDLYNYVVILKINGKFDLAAKWMKTFSQKYPDDLRAQSFNNVEAKFSELMKPNPSFKIKDLPFNNDEIDFGTTYFGDSVVFATSRGHAQFMERRYNWNKKHFLNLYIAKVENGNFVGLKNFSSRFNKKWHEGAASFSNNGTFLAYTSDNYIQKSSDDIVKLEIYFSEYKDKKWGTAFPFVLNSPEYSVGHPSLSEDGKTMYFASDMPGGYGGVDLYKIEKGPDGNWGKPVNLGRNINTEGDEMFPYYHEKSKTLFFASNGHYGLGGLDIYRAAVREKGYGKAKNIGAPINSKDDDFAFILDNDLKHGYFSSTRVGGKGDDDIYSFENSDPFSNADFTHELYVIDSRTKKVIPKATVLYCDQNSFETDKSGYISRKLDEMRDCEVTANALGYREGVKLIDISGNEGAVVRDTIALDMIVNEKIVLKNIYYDFDKWDILPESAVELDKLVSLMQENPEMKVELSSHTDNRGSKKYNLKLSQLRAESAVAYLVSKGISVDRLIAKGYGKSQPIHDCKKPEDCTPAQHRENRRTEIFIPGFGKGELVPQNKGDYWDGTQDHGKEYSSRKAHGSIFEKEMNFNVEIPEDLRKELKQAEANPVTAYSDSCYVILGSFPQYSGAVGYCEKVKQKGFNPIIFRHNQNYWAGIPCLNIKEAMPIQTKVREYFPAWIWKVPVERNIAPENARENSSTENKNTRNKQVDQLTPGAGIDRPVCYVILGSFPQESSAEIYASKVRNKGYSPVIFPHNQNRWVGIPCVDLKKAILLQNKIREEFPAWIWRCTSEESEQARPQSIAKPVSSEVVGKNKTEENELFYVVTGSYPDIKVSQALADDLIKKGYSPKIIEYNGYNRVCIVCDSYKKAKSVKNELKTDYPDVWIY